jgi:hypothetical protein
MFPIYKVKDWVSSVSILKDLRGGQKGTGPEQTLLVLESKEKSLDNLLFILKELTPKLPYN